MKPFQEFYQAKEWLKAMQWLDNHKTQLGEGLYEFNKGVISLKLDQYPQARYHFEKAKVTGFDDPWVYKNIESIRSELGLQLIEPKPFHEIIKTKVMSVLSLDILITVVLITFLSTMIYWFRKKIQKSFYVLSSLTLLAFFLLFIVLNTSSQNYQLSKGQEAIILEQVSIYEGPSAIFEELGKLPPGLKVQWGNLDNGWAQIESPVNFRGWIQFNEKYIKTL
jgi:hypothetical protein